MASPTSLRHGAQPVGRLEPDQRQMGEHRPESNSFCSLLHEHGTSPLACASSRPEHARSSNHAPTSTGRQPDPPNACRSPELDLSSSPPRAVSRSLTPEPQSSSSTGGDNGRAQIESWSGAAGGGAGRFSFFHFPAEIRNMIYHHSLHWPDCADLYRTHYRQAAARPRDQQSCLRAHLRTPTILLLCRRITGESMPVLKSRWFVIDRLPPCMPPLPDGSGGFLRMAHFIGRETLQRLHYIDLRIGLGEGPMGSGWVWNRVLDELLGILNERNDFVHLRLLIRRCNQEDSPSIWATEMGEDTQIRKMSNPNVFKPGKITVDTWRVDGKQATLLTGRHQPEANEGPGPLCRTYPDRELFPGSIMQFVDALPEWDWSDEEIERRLQDDEGATSP